MGAMTPTSTEPVLPTRDDPVVRAGSELVGGPAGRRIRFVPDRWWTPVRVLVLLAVVCFALGIMQKKPCYDGGWFSGSTQYSHACYSDMPHLYINRGLADGKIPYFQETGDKDMRFLEYPVITGGVMAFAGTLARAAGDITDGDLQDEQLWFVMINALIMMACAVVTVVAVKGTSGRRPWDAAMVACAPALALNGLINWDLVAVALTAVAMWTWARRNVVVAGVMIGLATAAKLYPVLLLAPLFLLCLRSGRLVPFAKTAAAAVVSWLVVNLPVMLVYDGHWYERRDWYIREGWKLFYTFSQDRPADYGSIWLIVQQRDGRPLEHLNSYVTAILVLCCLAIAALVMFAPRRPRFAQVAFLIVAAFVLTNKVYSPQYVLWLIPLVVLARPRWRDFLIWQACEVTYFLGVWMYIASFSGKGLSQNAYHVVILLHLLGTAYICLVVVRDILRPDRDPVRADGSDDPSGGVLDRAPDVFVPTSVLARAGR
ncbi:glycosyltransferase family 87 protein [Embleya sp. NPDC001921]